MSDPSSDSAQPHGGSESDLEAHLAVNQLFNTAYGELRGLASSALRAQRSDHTLQPTALVHEVWLKLSSGLGTATNREHFLAVAARAMRQVLQDHARAVHAGKRSGRSKEVLLIDSDLPAGSQASAGIDALILVDVLDRLRKLNDRHAEITEVRILGGLTMPEVAATLDVSLRTVEADWTFARAWLRAELAQP